MALNKCEKCKKSIKKGKEAYTNKKIYCQDCFYEVTGKTKKEKRISWALVNY